MTTRTKDLLILIFFILFTLILFRQYILYRQIPINGNLLISFYQPWASYTWDGYVNGPPAKPIGFDTLRMFYPLRSLVTQSWKEGHLPLWNPYSFSGNVTLGTYQSAVFHPLSFLFYILPQIDAWSIIMMLAPILTSVFMYMFLVELGISRKGSLFGSIIFAFSGIMIVWWEEMFMSVYSFLPLPLALFSISRIFSTRKIYPFYLLVGSFVFSILSGYFQTTFYLALMVICWTTYLLFKSKENKHNLRSVIVILAAGLVSVLLCGIQLFPAYEAYRLSPRGVTDVKDMFSQFFIPFNHIITLLAPDFFGNPSTHNFYGTSFYHEKVIWFTIPGLYFALLSVLNIKKNTPLLIFFTLTGLIFFSLAFALPTSWYLLYSLHLPFISEMTPSRIVYLSVFCFSILSSFGLDQFLKDQKWKKNLLLTSVLLFFFCVLGYSAFVQYSGIKMYDKIPLRNLFFPSIIFIFFVASVAMGFFRKLKNLSYVAILLLTLVSIGYFCNKYLYFSKRAYIYPETPVTKELQRISGIYRFTSIGEGYINRNFSQNLGLFSPEGYESFNIERYNQLVMSSHTQGILPKALNRADVSLYPAKNIEELSSNLYTLKMMSLLGIKYVVLHHSQTALSQSASANFSYVWTDGVFDIYTYNYALPRYFLTDSYLVETNPQKILDGIYTPGLEMTRTIALEHDLHRSFQTLSKDDTVKLLSYQPERITFESSILHDALLFLSDNEYPGWIAKVDGNKTPIYRANFSFRAVVIPSGKHSIIFSYEPEYINWGEYTLALGLLSLFGISLSLRYFNKRV